MPRLLPSSHHPPRRQGLVMGVLPWVTLVVALVLPMALSFSFTYHPTMTKSNPLAPLRPHRPLSWLRTFQGLTPSSTSALWASVAAPVEEEAEAVVRQEKKAPSASEIKEMEKLETVFASLDAMKRTGDVPSKELLMDAMWLAFRTRQWARAWEILHMPNVQPDVELYHLGLTTLNRGKFQYKRALTLLKEMEDLGLSPNVTSYNVAMQICADSQRNKDVIRLLDKMKIRSIQPELSSYNIAVNALARQSDWKKAVKLFEFMQKESVVPDVYTYNAAMRACARDGAWQRALILLEDMVKKGILPTTGSYNAAMHACSVGGQKERAITFLEEMVRKGIPVDTDSFSIIVGACDDPKLAHRAMEFVDRMVELGIRPDLVTFSSLVTALAREGDYTPALKILQESKKYKLTFDPSLGVIRLLNYALSHGGLTPEVVQYSMKTLIEAGKVMEAMGFIGKGLSSSLAGTSPEIKALDLLQSFKERMAEAEAAASTGTPTIIDEAGADGDDAEFKEIRELCEAEDVSGAVEALKGKDRLRSALSKMVMECAVANKDYEAAVNILAIPSVRAGRPLYGRALHACALARAWSTVDEVLRDMEENKGIVPDDSIFLELLEGARLAGAFHKVTKYRAMMVDREVPPTVELCRSLMKSYMTVRKPGLALQVYRDSKERNQPIDNEIHALALVAYKDLRQWQEAYSLLKSVGSGATDEMYGSVIRAMSRAGLPDKAEDLFSKEIPKDKRGADSLNALMQTRRRRGDLDGAVALLVEAEGGNLGTGVVPNQYSYSTIMEGLSEAGRHKEALEVYRRFQSPSLLTSNLALGSLVADKQYDEALKLFKSMADAKMVPSDKTLLHAFAAIQAKGFDSSSLKVLEQL